MFQLVTEKEQFYMHLIERPKTKQIVGLTGIKEPGYPSFCPFIFFFVCEPFEKSLQELQTVFHQVSKRLKTKTTSLRVVLCSTVSRCLEIPMKYSQVFDILHEVLFATYFADLV